MRRQQFLGVLAGAATWTVAAQAQQSERPKRIGVLIGGAETDPEQSKRLAAFRQSLRALGWAEGRNIVIDSRYTAGEPARVEAHARDLIQRQYEVILAATTPVVAGLRQATRTVPIVFVNVSDPVGNGFVESMSRPGGNVTGFINIEGTLGGKWLGLLREIDPRLKRVAMMFNPETAPPIELLLAIIRKRGSLI